MSEKEIEDPVEKMLKKTGCIELHYKVQECIAEKQDWRKCQDIVQNFKAYLGLRSGKIAAQCSHAAILCYEKSLDSKEEILRSWIRRGQAKIVLKVNNLESLQEVYEKAKKMNIIAEFVKDAGHTQVSPGTITVLGIGPDRVEKIDNVTKDLKLL